MPPSRRRLFFGIALSPELRKRLTRLIKGWPEGALILTREENLHVTLYYLGFIAEDEIPGIGEKMRELVADAESFEMSFNQIEVVPDLASPKMVYLSGAPNPELLAFQERVEKAFSPYLAAKKSFRPHATLARIRRGAWAKMEQKPVLSQKVNFVEFVDLLSLFESVTIDGKRRYEAIDTFPLK